MILLVPLVVLLAVVVGTLAGWKWVLAPLLGAAFIHFGISSLRSMVRDGEAPAGPPEVVAGARTMYHCEECGTEVLLVVRGSAEAPRHCGTRMRERTEVARN